MSQWWSFVSACVCADEHGGQGDVVEVGAPELDKWTQVTPLATSCNTAGAPTAGVPVGPVQGFAASASETHEEQQREEESVTGVDANSPVLEAAPANSEKSVITESDLQRSMEQVLLEIQVWDPKDYIRHKMINKAVGNHGQVDLMQKAPAGVKFAAKRMPNIWMRKGPAEFAAKFPTSGERPWLDIGLLKSLNRIGYPHCCNLMGVFRDEEFTFVCTSLATHYDLYTWCDGGQACSPAREALVLPIAGHIFSAIHSLHEHGIAHRDLSLENMLLTESGDGELCIKVIDFGMATTSRFCENEIRGKPSYQAPEMHNSPYDAFLADAFSIGVILFAMAVQDYPWKSTAGRSCPLFQYAKENGFLQFTRRRKVRSNYRQCLCEVLSPDLVDILTGLLQIDPLSRLTMGESCFGLESSPSRQSVWDVPWSSHLAKKGPLPKIIDPKTTEPRPPG